MAQVNAGWFQNRTDHSAAQLRTYVGSLLAGARSASDLSRTRGGVHPALGGQLAVTQNGSPNMSVNVAQGVITIPGTDSTTQGVYFCLNDAVQNLAIATAPGAGQSRIDLVVAKIEDAAYAGAVNAWSLAVVTGTASASPSAPSPPASSITLAQIAVGSSVTSIVTGNITDTRQYMAGLGGLILVAGTTERNALVKYTGMPIYRLDTKRCEIWNGSTWDLVKFAIAPAFTTGGAGSFGPGETTILTQAWTQAQTGDNIRVMVSGQVVSNGADRQTTIRLKENGATIKTQVVGSPTNNLSFPFAMHIHRSPSAGTVTYTVTGQVSGFTVSINNDAELSIELA